MELDFEKLEGVLQVFAASSAKKLKLETGGLIIKAKRARGVFATPQPEPEPQDTEAGEQPEPARVVVRSDRVGVFYHGASPGEEPVVLLGENIARKSQVGCIVSIGIVNPLLSDVEGKLVEVLVTDGQPVEFGEPVLRVEVASGEGQ